MTLQASHESSPPAVWSSGSTVQIGRQTLWAARTAYHRTVLRNRPRVVCNSFHKAGTHLLLGAVSAVPGLHHYGRSAYWHYLVRASVRRKSTAAAPEEVARRLDSCLPGEVVRGHIAAHPLLVRTLALPGFRHLLIFRDPRDVVVSHLFWWKSQLRNAYWPYRIFRELDTDDDRLRFLIEGMDERRPPSSDVPEGVRYPDIGGRMAEFLSWFEEASCRSVRFEDLVDSQRRSGAIKSIARHVLSENDEEEIRACVDAMAVGTDPSRSKTFRRGEPGEWRRHFSQEHKDLFKHYAGETLIRLGYERDMDW